MGQDVADLNAYLDYTLPSIPGSTSSGSRHLIIKRMWSLN
jgi:hypothetical protein